MSDAIRLNKRLSQLGYCSRREADEYILKNWILVNGQVAHLGQKVYSQDIIEIKHQARHSQKRKVTILLNKPIGYVSSQPENNYPCASELITMNRYFPSMASYKIKPTWLQGLAPAGRLDIDSTGLLVLTQDGRIAKMLIGQDSPIEKEYLVTVQGQLSAQGLALLNHGLSLDGEVLRPTKVSWHDPSKRQLKFILRQGKKRQIRRMCEQVNLRVVYLKRVRIGQIHLGDLLLGRWRLLESHEYF